MIKFYKIRHKETGFFFKPLKHPDKNNLSKFGKIYARKPTLKHLQGLVCLGFVKLDDKFILLETKTSLQKFNSADWEIVEYIGQEVAVY